eukprot:4857012-Amphidinium_carterae.1
MSISKSAGTPKDVLEAYATCSAAYAEPTQSSSSSIGKTFRAFKSYTIWSSASVLDMVQMPCNKASRNLTLVHLQLGQWKQPQNKAPESVVQEQDDLDEELLHLNALRDVDSSYQVNKLENWPTLCGCFDL